MSGLLKTMQDPYDFREGESRNLSSLREFSPVPSPLKLFGQAKRKINDIYAEIATYINESNAFLSALPLDDGIVQQEHVDTARAFCEKAKAIEGVLARDHMKVVFFGRTSNGKSTVINAMLKDKILPMGIGHTTNCFVQVEGSASSEAYLLTEDSEAPKNIQSIRDLAHALSSLKLDCKSLIRILWPKNKCALLKEDVVFVDSPGIDVTPDLDSWIDKFCLDADVFILVVNAESTLMQTEKNFFHKVNSKLSKPNMFILNNRWDASASEPEIMEEVRTQHMERNVAFLADELKVVDAKTAEDRVFFVSAKEAVISRIHQEKGTPTPSEEGMGSSLAGVLQEGFQGRLFEFANFERKFEECISKSAVKTKFEMHAARGKTIASDLRTIMDAVYSNAVHKKEDTLTKSREAADQLDFTEKQLMLLTNEIKDKITKMTEEVERKVASALNEEIRRLSVLVDEFDRPFHPDPMQLTWYKKELHGFVEKSLGLNIQTRCSAVVVQGCEQAQIEMKERLTALLPEEQKQHAQNVLPRRDFEVAYRVDCRNLCADFREDIEFRFSLGITSLVNRFLGSKNARTAFMGYSDSIPRPLATPQTPSNEFQPVVSQESEVMMSLLATFTSLYSRTTIGAFAITGLVAKAAGWRIIAVAGAIYGLLYMYEWMTWTNKAKERAFKRQYVDYASSKLKLIVDLTGSNCSHQVQQELSATFSRLAHLVDVTKGDLESEVKQLKQEIGKLDATGSQAKVLKNKANFLDSELDQFIHTYLEHDS